MVLSDLYWILYGHWNEDSCLLLFAAVRGLILISLRAPCSYLRDFITLAQKYIWTFKRHLKFQKHAKKTLLFYITLTLHFLGWLLAIGRNAYNFWL